MPHNDREYFARRAETEERLAARAGHPCAAYVHRTLARLYRARAGGARLTSLLAAP